MQKEDTLSKIFAILGTTLVWLPVLAPVILGFFSLLRDGLYRFDYLMPAELGLVVFVGGAALIGAALRSGLRRKIIGWGLGLAVGSIAVLMAFGDVVPGSLEWGLAIGLLVSYAIAIVVMGIGGTLLCRDLFGNTGLPGPDPI